MYKGMNGGCSDTFSFMVKKNEETGGAMDKIGLKENHNDIAPYPIVCVCVCT